MPAACVIVAKAAPRSRSRDNACQSSAKPAEGGSSAAGAAAIGVHTFRRLNSVSTYAYWIGRPCTARPAQISSIAPSKRSATSRGWPARPRTRAASGPSCNRSPRRKRGGARRSSVRMRRSPSPSTTATQSRTSRGSSEPRCASRTSIGAPLGTWTPARLAGSVAASFATMRSPRSRSSGQRSRGRCEIAAFARTTRSFASGGRWIGLEAAITRPPLGRRRSRASPPGSPA